MSIGLNLNAAAGYLINPNFEGINGALTIDSRNYLTFRYGQRATSDNVQDVGFGFGIGYNYQLLPFPLGAPNIYIDFTFGYGKIIKISYDLSKKYMYNYYSSEGLVPVFEFREIGFHFGYTLWN